MALSQSREAPSRHLYRRQGARVRGLLVSGAISLAGCALLVGYGREGLVLMAIGVVALAFAIVRGRRPLVTLDPTTVTLRFRERERVPFISIVRVDQLRSHDLELCLESGVKVSVPMALLDDDDATWLRKELRREVRTSNSRRAR
jgi:hypothetical protein